MGKYQWWGNANELQSDDHSRVKTFKYVDGAFVPFAQDIVVNHPNRYHDGFGYNLDISDDGKGIERFAGDVEMSGDGSVILVGSRHSVNHRHSSEGLCSVYDGTVMSNSGTAPAVQCPEPAPESVLLKVDGYKGETSELLNLVAQVLFDNDKGTKVSLLGATSTLEPTN